MDEWMDGWVSGWVSGWMYGWIDGLTRQQINKWRHGLMNGYKLDQLMAANLLIL